MLSDISKNEKITSQEKNENFDQTESWKKNSLILDLNILHIYP